MPFKLARLSIAPETLRSRELVQALLQATPQGAGVTEIRFHALRHTCATLLLGRGGNPKFVQELLGYATIAITLDTYSHYLPSRWVASRPAPWATTSDDRVNAG